MLYSGMIADDFISALYSVLEIIGGELYIVSCSCGDHTDTPSPPFILYYHRR